MDARAFIKLIDFLAKVPAISGSTGSGADEDGHWWVKFEIDTNHEFAW